MIGFAFKIHFGENAKFDLYIRSFLRDP